jgi:alkylhydroperoxidase family enzyme
MKNPAMIIPARSTAAASAATPAQAARHYDVRGLAALILMIATTNVFNRLNVATRQVAGS